MGKLNCRLCLMRLWSARSSFSAVISQFERETSLGPNSAVLGYLAFNPQAELHTLIGSVRTVASVTPRGRTAGTHLILGVRVRMYRSLVKDRVGGDRYNE